MAKYSINDTFISKSSWHISSNDCIFYKGNTYKIIDYRYHSYDEYLITVENGNKLWFSEYVLELFFKKNDYGSYDYAMDII
jgi:hypothetical protein